MLLHFLYYESQLRTAPSPPRQILIYFIVDFILGNLFIHQKLRLTRPSTECVLFGVYTLVVKQKRPLTLWVIFDGQGPDQFVRERKTNTQKALKIVYIVVYSYNTVCVVISIEFLYKRTHTPLRPFYILSLHN